MNILLEMLASNNDCLNKLQTEIITIYKNLDSFMPSKNEIEKVNFLESQIKSYMKSNKLIRKLIKGK